MKNKTIRLTPIALLLACGAAANAQFVFQPNCNNNWYGDCGTSTPCTGGGWITYNNWGQTGCAGGLPTPGAGNTAQINGACNVNGAIGVTNLFTSGSSVLALGGGVAVSSPCTTLGTWNVVAGNNSVSGAYTNNGTWTWQIGWNTNLNDFVFTNNGVFDIQARSFNLGAGTNALYNNGQFIKSTGSGSSIAGLPITHQGGQFAVQAGALYLDSLTLTTLSPATYAVSSGATFYLRSDTLRGVYAGTNAGLFRLENCSTDQDTTLAITGNPVDINGNFSILSSKVLENMGLLQNVNGNNTIAGDIDNYGTFTHATGWNTTLTSCILVNNPGATFDLQSRSFSQGGGSALINQGAFIKSSGSSASFDAVPIINNSVLAVTGGALYLDALVLTGGPTSQWVNAGTLYMRGDTLRGTFGGANTGFARIESCTFDQDSSVSFTTNALDINGDMAVAAGATLVNNGLLQNINGNNSFYGSIVNAATLTHDTGWNTTLNGCTLVNNPGATFRLLSRSFNNAGVGSTLINNGSLVKSSGGNAFFTGLPVVNNAALTVEAGSLYVDGCTVTSAPASTWNVPGGQVIFRGSTLRGSFTSANTGFVRLESCTFDQNSTVNITGNPVDINGNLSVAAGATLTNAGVMNDIQGNNGFYGNFTNSGQINFDAGWNTSIGSGVFTNAPAGVLTLNSRSFNDAGGGSFVNNGLIIKTSGGTVSFNLPITNGGLIRHDAGRLYLNAGVNNTAAGVVRCDAELWFPGGFSLTNGRLEGTGTLVAQPTLAVAGGRIAPGDGVGGVGTLALYGNLEMAGGGLVEVDVSGPASINADRLNLASGWPQGVATLGGVVTVNRAGGYIPTPGTRWTILTFRERVGEFAGVAAANPVGGVSYRLIYAPTYVDLLTLGSCGAADVGGTGGVPGPDGRLDNNDFIVFIDSFFNHDPIADVGVQGGVPGTDGEYNNNDFIVFINAFFQGCQG